MAEEDLLAFYQQFYSESLFILPEQVVDTKPVLPVAGTPASRPVTTAPAEPIDDGGPAVKKFTVSGKNNKGLALLFSLPEADFNALPQNEFLIKILAAIHHTPADVVFVNIQPNYALNLFDLSKATPVQQVVAFGSGLVDLATGFQINLYKPAGIGETSLLLAEPLQNIQNDVNRKKLLWNGLQAIFIK